MDSRLAALEQWLARQLDGAAYRLAPASEDASFRRYFRAHLAGGRPHIVMDAPRPEGDGAPFVRIAQLLRDAGLHAPEVHAQDLAQGFLLLSDLGTTTYLTALQAGDADSLMRDAIDALLRWQLATRAGALPPYDEALLQREMALFPDWYVARHVGKTLAAERQAELQNIFALL